MQSKDLVTSISELTPSQQKFLAYVPSNRELHPGTLATRLGLSPATVRRWRRQEPFKSTYERLLEASGESFPQLAVERAKASSWRLTESLIALAEGLSIDLPSNKLGHTLAATDKVLKLSGLLKDGASTHVDITFEAAILQALAVTPEAKPYWES